MNQIQKKLSVKMNKLSILRLKLSPVCAIELKIGGVQLSN